MTPTMSFAVTGQNAEGKNTRRVSHPRKETKISAQDSERKARAGYGARRAYHTLYIHYRFSILSRPKEHHGSFDRLANGLRAIEMRSGIS